MVGVRVLGGIKPLALRSWFHRQSVGKSHRGDDYWWDFQLNAGKWRMFSWIAMWFWMCCVRRSPWPDFYISP